MNVQIARRGIRDRDVLDAMRQVPREDFVSPGYEEFAYQDGPLPISEGQTISQPCIVALMIQAAELKRGDRVLEVGTGSGYAAAVMSRIAGRVYPSGLNVHYQMSDLVRLFRTLREAATT